MRGELAVQNILSIRPCVKKRKNRAATVFKPPELHQDARSKWGICCYISKIYELRLTRHLSDSEINQLIESAFLILEYPGHSQLVEWQIKLVSEACKKSVWAPKSKLYINRQGT